jgi:excisionase family DNA binding protein
VPRLTFPAADHAPEQRGYTPAELARLLRVSADRIRAWIKRGELRALNVAPGRLGKPRFVVLPHHLEEFERKRRVATPAARPAPRRRQPAGVVDYFPD